MEELESLVDYTPSTYREPKTDEALFAQGYARLPAVLRRLGFEKLRKGQDNAVYSVLGGVDTICIMPTAMGKSAVFIVPTLCHQWQTLIFSPLKALMRDQVRKLQELGIAAFAISSDSTPAENDYALRCWADGECDILYAAPERLANDTFKQAMRQRSPDMIAIDEVHTLSSWSDNFRHAYTLIGDAIERYQPRTVLAVTATFNKPIEKDVRRVLGLPRAKKIVSYTPRENLKLSSSWMESKQDVLDKVREHHVKTLIYCGSQKNTEEYAQYLGKQLKEEVGIYHADVNGAVKKSCQDRFARKNDLRIICATNAFGMGVDIPDIGAVLHVIYPADPEALDQECGRGGRDGNDCFCHAFESQWASNFQLRILEGGNPPKNLFERVFKAMRAKADASDTFHMDGQELAVLSNVSDNYHMAILQTLQGARVIETVKGHAKVYRMKIIEEPAWEDTDKKAEKIHYARMVQFIRKEFSMSNGFYDFDLDVLAQMMGLAPATTGTHLRNWHKEERIQYEPPPRATPKRIIGDLSLVDFDRLALKRQDAFKKLDYVKGYFGTPDHAKAGYLRDYYLATSGD